MKYIGRFTCVITRPLSAISVGRDFIKDAYEDYDPNEHKYEWGEMGSEKGGHGWHEFWYEVHQLSDDEKKELKIAADKEAIEFEKQKVRNYG